MSQLTLRPTSSQTSYGASAASSAASNVIAFPSAKGWQDRQKGSDRPALEQDRQSGDGQGQVARRDGGNREQPLHYVGAACMVVPLTMAALSLVIVLLAREILDHSQRLLKSALHLAFSRPFIGDKSVDNSAGCTAEKLTVERR